MNSSPDVSPPTLPPIVLVRRPRARRYILRVTHDAIVQVTIPRGGNEAYARAFALRHAGWITHQIQRRRENAGPPPRWGPGTLVWLRGERIPLNLTDAGLTLGPLQLPAPAADTDWRAVVEPGLRALATRELPPLVRAAAARFGVPVGRVQIRAQRTRWGSCSRRRTISLNWRLVQIPEAVRDYLIVHELAHLREMNHSDRFWRVVEAWDPSWRNSERWLRRYGRAVLS